VKQFNYLGCELNLDGEEDFDSNKQIPKNMWHNHKTSEENPVQTAK